MLMNIKIDYMGVSVVIDTNSETINIIKNDGNSEKLLNMIFKAILKQVNINTNGYKIVRKC